MPLKAELMSENEFRLRERIKELDKEVESLQAIKSDYREIVEHATEIIFKLDSSGAFYFVSVEFGGVPGYTNEHLAGKHFSSIVHPDDLLCMKTFDVLKDFGKADDNVCLRVRDYNGQYRWIDCSAVCHFDEKKSFADITQTKKVAQAVVDAQEKERAEIGYELHAITDNGKRFDKENVKTKRRRPSKYIANRAELINGKMNMVKLPGNGCKLNIIIPL